MGDCRMDGQGVSFCVEINRPNRRRIVMAAAPDITTESVFDRCKPIDVDTHICRPGPRSVRS